MAGPLQLVDPRLQQCYSSEQTSFALALAALGASVLHPTMLGRGCCTDLVRYKVWLFCP